MGGRTKKQRQAWWNALFSDDKEKYIARRQKQKEKHRQNRLAKVQRISRKYPWTNQGVFVDDSNREQWR